MKDLKSTKMFKIKAINNILPLHLLVVLSRMALVDTIFPYLYSTKTHKTFSLDG